MIYAMGTVAVSLAALGVIAKRAGLNEVGNWLLAGSLIVTMIAAATFR